MAERNRSEQRLARMLKESEGIKYTEALRRVRAFLAAKESKKMAYSVINPEGEEVLGDRELTDYLKSEADKINGWVRDDNTGEQVYPVPIEIVPFDEEIHSNVE